MRHLQALCVARHRFLADHIARFFNDVGVDAATAVGLEEAVARAKANPPDVVVCEYDLLATVPLDQWERDDVLARTPVVAVSLTRRPDEMHPLDVNGIGGFLYLPTLRAADAQRILYATASRPTDSVAGGTFDISTTSFLKTL